MSLFWWIAKPSVLVKSIVICAVYLVADQLGWQAALKRVSVEMRVNVAGLSDTEASAVQTVVTNMLERKQEKMNGTGTNQKPEARTRSSRTDDQNRYRGVGEIAATRWRQGDD